MTATYNPAEVERLIAEAREDDRILPPLPWQVIDEYVYDSEQSILEELIDDKRAIAIARTRNNLGAMADQLEAARAEIDQHLVADLTRLRSDLVERDASIVQLVAQRDEYQRQADQQRARVAELEGELRVRDDRRQDQIR